MKLLLSLIAVLALFSPRINAETIVEITAVTSPIDNNWGSFTIRFNPNATQLSSPSEGGFSWDFSNYPSVASAVSGTYITGDFYPDSLSGLSNSGTGANAYFFLYVGLDQIGTSGLSFQGSLISGIEIDFFGNIPFTYDTPADPISYFASYAGTYTSTGVLSAISLMDSTGSEPARVSLDSLTITVIPEPGTMILTGLSGMLLFAYGARRRKRLS